MCHCTPRTTTLTVHPNGDISTAFNLLNRRMVWSAVHHTVDLEQFDGQVLYVYPTMSRDAFIHDQLGLT